MAKGLFGTVVRTISTDCWGISDLDLMRSGVQYTPINGRIFKPQNCTLHVYDPFIFGGQACQYWA